MGLVSAVSTKLGAKLMAKGFVSKFLAKGVIGVVSIWEEGSCLCEV